MEQAYYYDAFISYRHLPEDIRIAEKLQSLLERLKKTDPATGKKKPLRIFRDQSELPVSEDLSKDIEDSLHNSDYLIIICSPKLKESKWCMKELSIFRQLHGNTNAHIIPLLIEGEPEDSFPGAIRFRTPEDGSAEQEEIEPLAADVRAAGIDAKLKKLKKTEYMRIAAPIMGLRFDDLYQRRKRERNRRILIGSSVAAVLLIAFLMYYVYAQGQLSSTQLLARQTEAERIAELSETKQNDPALAYLLAQHAYNMFPNEKDIPDKVKQTFTGNELSYLVGMKNDLLSLQFSDSLPSAVGDLMRVIADGKRLALTDGSNTYLYDLATGERLFSCKGSAVYFDPDGEIAASSFVKDGKNTCIFYRTDTGEALYTLENERRTAAAATMDVYWENGACYAVDSDNGSRVFEIRFSGDGRVEVSEELSKADKEHILSVCNCYDYPSYYLKVFRDGAVSAAMTEIAEYKSVTDAQINAVVSATTKGYNVTDIQPGEKYGLLKAATETSTDTLIYSEDSGNLLRTVNGSLYYDTNSGYYIGANNETVSVYRLNEGFSATRSDRFYPHISADGERFFCLSGESMDRFYGKGGLIRMTVCDMTNAASGAGLTDTPIYTSTMGQSYFCYCDRELNRVFYMDPDADYVVYEVKTGKELLRWHEKEPENVQALSISDDGTLLAVAYSPKFREYQVAVYSAETGKELQTIELTGKLGKPTGTDIMHIEITGDWMLVSSQSDSVLLERKNDTFSADSADYYENCANRSVPWSFSVSEDGLLFFNDYMGGTDLTHSCPLRGVYRISDRKELSGLPYARAFIYSAEKKCLITEDFVSDEKDAAIRHAGAICKYLYQDGELIKEGEISSENADMHLAGGLSLDADHLLLENSTCSEVYDITTLKLVFRLNTTGMLLSGGRIINPASDVPNAESSYSYLTDSKTLQSTVTEAMKQQLGRERTLTEAEKEKYAVKD